MEVQSERNDNFIKSPYRCRVKGSDSGEGVGIEIPSKSLEAERYGREQALIYMFGLTHFEKYLK